LQKTPIPFNYSKDINNIPTRPQQPFRYWDYKEEQKLKSLWNNGKTVSMIATDLNRSPKAVWMRLQRFNLITSNNEYDNSKNHFN
jgi:hypothetical protein